MVEVSVFWFRRDLRVHDNTGFYHALRNGYPVVPVFIFDKNILEELDEKEDARVITEGGSGLRVRVPMHSLIFEYLTLRHRLKSLTKTWSTLEGG